MALFAECFRRRVVNSDDMRPDDFVRLVDRHAAPLILYARQWGAAPEDVVQEAFLKLVAQRQPPRNVVAWLYRVVRNTALDMAKKSRRQQRREATAARLERWFVEPQIDGLDAAAAVAALQHLATDEREVLVARLWGGLSFEEIAEVAGCSASTAFRRYHAGLEQLRKELGVSCPNRSPNT